jgi:hypothetical protein
MREGFRSEENSSICRGYLPALLCLVLGTVFAVKGVLVTDGLELQGVEHRRRVCGRPHPGPTNNGLVSAGDE